MQQRFFCKPASYRLNYPLISSRKLGNVDRSQSTPKPIEHKPDPHQPASFRGRRPKPVHLNVQVDENQAYVKKDTLTYLGGLIDKLEP